MHSVCIYRLAYTSYSCDRWWSFCYSGLPFLILILPVCRDSSGKVKQEEQSMTCSVPEGLLIYPTLQCNYKNCSPGSKTLHMLASRVRDRLSRKKSWIFIININNKSDSLTHFR